METTDLREIEEVMETLLSYHTDGNEEDVMDMNMEIFEGYRNDMEERIVSWTAMQSSLVWPTNAASHSLFQLHNHSVDS